MLRSKCIAVVVVLIAFIGVSDAGNCVQCTSAINPWCVRDLPDFLIRSLPCVPNENNGCFVRVNPDGQTERGCLLAATRPACVTDELCTPCPLVAGAGNGCNIMRTPATRRTCHQCSNNLQSVCAQPQNVQSTVCELFTATDRCFIHRNETGITRGCETGRGILCENQEHCHFCNADGCNSQIFNAPNVPLAPSAASIIATAIPMILAGVAFVSAFV